MGYFDPILNTRPLQDSQRRNNSRPSFTESLNSQLANQFDSQAKPDPSSVNYRTRTTTSQPEIIKILPVTQTTTTSTSTETSSTTSSQSTTVLLTHGEVIQTSGT